MNLWWEDKVSSKSVDQKMLAEKFNETRMDQADTSGGQTRSAPVNPPSSRAHLYVPKTDLASMNIPVHFGTDAPE